MTAVAYAPLPQEQVSTETPMANANLDELQTPRVLFFAMDAVTPTEKRELPFKAFGGIYLPSVKTLPDANKGMLYRCQFTLLPAYKMVADWNVMVGPKGESWDKGYVKNVNGKEVIVDGFLGSATGTEEGEFKQKKSKHLVFRKRYPAQDVRLATKRTEPHGAGGVVEIKALKGANVQDVAEAQIYFFPEWMSIRTGSKLLPSTVREMEGHITDRRDAIADQPWSDEKKQRFYSIATDMLTSCSEFRWNAVQTVNADSTIVKVAGDRGAGEKIRHSRVSELFLEQTETKRKEDVLTGQSNDVATLAREMREERVKQTELDRQRLNLEERKQYTAELAAGLRERDEAEEIRLGIKKVAEKPVTVSAPVIPDATTEVVPEEPSTAPVAKEVGDTIILKDGDGPGELVTLTDKRFGRLKVTDSQGVEKYIQREDIYS